MTESIDDIDTCPECGANFQLIQPSVRRQLEGGVRHGGLPAFLAIDDGKVYVQAALECPECDWSYEGRAELEEL